MAYRFALQWIIAIILLAASVVEFSSAADYCDHGNVDCTDSRIAWAVAVGVVSTGISIFILVFAYVRTKYEITSGALVYIDMFMAIILVVLWIFGAAYNTKIGGLFDTPCNGFFSTWIALIASLYFLHMLIGEASVRRNAYTNTINWNGPIIVLLASLVELGTAADWYHQDMSGSRNRQRWAIAVGAISTAICLVQLMMLYCRVAAVEATSRPVSIFLVCLWAAGAGVNTSARGPFNQTNNGYFASWVAFVASIEYFWCAFFRDNVPAANPADLPPETSTSYGGRTTGYGSTGGIGAGGLGTGAMGTAKPEEGYGAGYSGYSGSGPIHGTTGYASGYGGYGRSGATSPGVGPSSSGLTRQTPQPPMGGTATSI